MHTTFAKIRDCGCGPPGHYPISIKNLSVDSLTSLTLQERLRQIYPQFTDFVNWRNARDITLGSNWFNRIIGYPDWIEWLRSLRAIEIEPAADLRIPKALALIFV